MDGKQIEYGKHQLIRYNVASTNNAIFRFKKLKIFECLNGNIELPYCPNKKRNVTPALVVVIGN